MSDFPTEEGLLTQAEVDLAARRVESNGLSRDDAVKSVKQERVGTAARFGREDEIPARNVPGGEIANPNPNAVSASQRKADLERELERVADELAAVETEIDDTVIVPPANPETGSTEPEVNTNDLDRNNSSQIEDDDLRKATVEELVFLVEEYPELRDRVIALEREKGDKARKSLFAALGEEGLA